MSNVGADRRVESDWWAHPIPPNVDFGEGFYCETAQVFRFMKTKERTHSASAITSRFTPGVPLRWE